MIVNISGTMAKDQKPNNGLDVIAEKLNANRLQRVAVVAIIEYHGFHQVRGKPDSISVSFAAIEPLEGKDDTMARTLLDKARRERGLGSAELTLFELDPHAGAAGGPPWPGDADYIGPADGADKASGPEPESKPKRTRKPRTGQLSAVPDAPTLEDQATQEEATP